MGNLKIQFAASLIALAIAIFSSGCINDNQTASDTSTAGSVSKATGTSTTSAGPSFTIASGVVTPDTSSSASGSTNPPKMTLAFNATNLSSRLTDVCQVQASGADPSRACKCRYIWTEKNTSDSSNITRTVDTDPTQITSFQVQCPVPTVFENEISDGTFIKISFVPSGLNNTGFSTNTLEFKKQPITTSGDFRDIEGKSFKNIFHYVCYDKFPKSLLIRHRVKSPGSSSSNLPLQLPVANDFETGSLTPNSFSAQSYYFDFYLRSNEIGQVNAGNQSFTCPVVNVNGVPNFFPLDSTFALALNASANYPVRVTAATAIPVQGQPAQGTVVGFAAKPNADGTCPVFIDQNNQKRRTFRLRQYTAIYPIRYKADGDVADLTQPINTVYVLDRPVNKLGQDPDKPITRLGPKPCPFSFKTAQFGYQCSTASPTSLFNVDGTEIQGDPGCPVYPPPPDKYQRDDGTLVIRPYKPFLSHFLENTAFKACAFPSSTPVDPEIVLSHDDNIFPSPTGPKDFYCAKHYPPAGAIVPPPNGDPFDKPPGDCDLASAAAAIKTNKTYACSRTFDPTNNLLNTPSAGCCQICSGTNCTSAGGGTNAAGRNAAFSPPQNAGNPAQAMKTLPRAEPNKAGQGGCFDPSED